MLDKQKIARAADELARKGQFEKAIREYQRLVQENPDDDFAWLKIGDLFVKKGDPKQGALCYLKAAEHYASREPEKAIKVFQAVLSLDPSQVQCHQRLALLYHSLGRDREAMEQLEPYATYFEQNAKPDEAIQVRQRMLDLVSDYLPVRLKLAELYSQQDKREEAAREFGKVAKQLKQMGRIADFTKVVERLLFHKPDDKEHLLALSKVYLEQKNPKEALGKLQGLFVIDPKNLDVLDLLADTFVALGQSPKAIRVLKEIARQRPEMKTSVYQRILEVDPEDQDAKTFLAPVPSGSKPDIAVPQPAAPGLSLVGIPSLPSQIAKLPKAGSDKAEKEAKVAKKLAEAELYVKFGLQEKAIEHLQDALQIDPDHKRLMAILKDLYIGVADYRRASPLLIKLARNSTPDEAKVLLEQLFGFDSGNVEAQALYRSLGGNLKAEEEEISEGDFIEEAEEDILEEVAELVEQVEAQEAAIEPVKRPTTRPGATVIQMSPFFEVAEVMEVAEVPREAPRAGLSKGASYAQQRAQSYSSGAYPSPKAQVDSSGFSGEVTYRANVARPAQVRTKTMEVEIDPALFAPTPQHTLDDRLSEVDFFLQQGLYQDARSLIEELYQAYPSEPRVRQRYQDLSPSQGRETTVTTADPAPMEAEEEVSTGEHEAPPGAGSPFELGLTYRERGQTEEAVREFQHLIGTGVGDAICYHLIGVCYGDKGRYPEAIDAFKRALHVGGLSFEDELGIYYALGATHEAVGDGAEAIYYYQRVYQREPRFRDVSTRLAKLQGGGGKRPRQGESGASPLPVRRDSSPVAPQAVARSRDDDDRYS